MGAPWSVAKRCVIRLAVVGVVTGDRVSFNIILVVKGNPVVRGGWVALQSVDWSVRSRLVGLGRDFEEGESARLTLLEDVVEFLKDSLLVLSSQDAPQHVGRFLMVACCFLSCQRFEMIVTMFSCVMFSVTVIDPSFVEVQ